MFTCRRHIKEMNYYILKHTAPRGLKRAKKTRRLTPKAVLLFFLAESVLFILFGGIIQMRLGMGGITITELAMLVLSVGFVLLYHASLRDVFPIRKPKLLGLFGCAVLWFAAILTVVIVNLFFSYFFPEPYQSLGEGDTVFKSVPFLLQVLIVAVLPAVCEEALHRGVIQSGIGSRVKNPVLLSLIMGGIFAVFHLYPVKYPSMLILGGMISYILAVTGNMVYSSFVHFLNNFVSLLVDQLTGGLLSGALQSGRTGWFLAAGELYNDTPAPKEFPFTYIGVSVMTIGIIIPTLLYIGDYLLKRATAPVRPFFVPEGEKHPIRNRIVIPTVLILLAGVLMILL